eukprot:1874359-Pleurochrysis_carterae.AAC.11
MYRFAGSTGCAASAEALGAIQAAGVKMVRELEALGGVPVRAVGLTYGFTRADICTLCLAADNAPTSWAPLEFTRLVSLLNGNAVLSSTLRAAVELQSAIKSDAAAANVFCALGGIRRLCELIAPPRGRGKTFALPALPAALLLQCVCLLDAAARCSERAQLEAAVHGALTSLLSLLESGERTGAFASELELLPNVLLALCTVTHGQPLVSQELLQNELVNKVRHYATGVDSLEDVTNIANLLLHSVGNTAKLRCTVCRLCLGYLAVLLCAITRAMLVLAQNLLFYNAFCSAAAFRVIRILCELKYAAFALKRMHGIIVQVSAGLQVEIMTLWHMSKHVVRKCARALLPAECCGLCYDTPMNLVSVPTADWLLANKGPPKSKQDSLQPND